MEKIPILKFGEINVRTIESANSCISPDHSIILLIVHASKLLHTNTKKQTQVKNHCCVCEKEM